MRLIKTNITVFAIFISAQSALADQTSLQIALDNLTCVGQGIRASSAMVIRQMDPPSGKQRADLELRAIGDFDDKLQLTHEYYLSLAYTYPIEDNRKAQQERFQESAAEDCVKRLQSARKAQG